MVIHSCPGMTPTLMVLSLELLKADSTMLPPSSEEGENTSGIRGSRKRDNLPKVPQLLPISDVPQGNEAPPGAERTPWVEGRQNRSPPEPLEPASR
jgi:hypothetical protein